LNPETFREFTLFAVPLVSHCRRICGLRARSESALGVGLVEIYNIQ